MTYDCQLSFSCHAALVDNSQKRQTEALQKLASKCWGYDCQTLCANYIATGCSKVEYGASLRLPWKSNSMLENLERSQCYAGQAITGQLRTTPVKVIFAEANLPSIKTWAIQQSTIAFEKLLRTTPTNPGHTTATQRVRQHTQRQSGVKKQVMRRKTSLVILSSKRHSKLNTHGLTPALTPMSQQYRGWVTPHQTMQ